MTVIAVLVIAGSALAVSVFAAPPSYEDWYPSDVTPPAGTQYPCALTALPRDLPGIPAADRRFINHSYSLVLKATQAKLVLLNALGGGGPYGDALGRYLDATGEAMQRLSAEPVPAGLEPFTADVAAALGDQQAFFRAAAAQRAKGVSMTDVYKIPEGRRASSRLMSAWTQMQKRYPAWDPPTRESLYHHLCALDLF
jgi:hypothetical protein